MKGRQDHNSLVKGLIEFFEESGFQVQYARYEGYSKPFSIKRHAPDVIAMNKEKGLAIIGEAKMCSELEDQITKEQFEDYGIMLMKGGKSEKTRLPFFIAVPQECESKIPESFRQFEIPWQSNIIVKGF